MNHGEVRQLNRELIVLINHCVEKKVDIYHINYGLDKNHSRLEAADASINKQVSAELKELEGKVWELAKKKSEDKPQFDLILLPKKDQKRHGELLMEFNKFLEEPDDFEPYMLNPEKCEDLKIEYPFYLILKKFLPEEKEPIKETE